MQSLEVLLIEDNIYDAELAIRSLRKHNLANEIIHIEDGEEALDFIFERGRYAKRASGNPTLILLDLMLPKVNGIEILRQVKADPKTATIPVVILSSSDLDPSLELCKKLGAVSYITKPLNIEGLFKSVANLGVYWLMVHD
ncbi:MAG: response regulator [Chitinophagales bacterium]